MHLFAILHANQSHTMHLHRWVFSMSDGGALRNAVSASNSALSVGVWVNSMRDVTVSSALSIFSLE